MKPLLTLTLALMVSSSFLARGQAGSAGTRADTVVRRSAVRVVPFVDAIDSVLADLTNNLRQVSGELVLAEGGADNYVSLVAVPGATDCMVTRYHSTADTTASWKAKMFSGGDFGAVSKKYQQLFQQLKFCCIRLPDSSVYYLDGTWQPAREGVTFTTTVLKLKTGDQRFRDVEVDLELVYQLADWAVNINIMTKKRDDEVGMRAGN